jgi:PAS domain S-box-containing protein
LHSHAVLFKILTFPVDCSTAGTFERFTAGRFSSAFPESSNSWITPAEPGGYLKEIIDLLMMRICRLIAPALLLLLFIQPLYAAEPRQTKRVLVIYSDDVDHPAHQMTQRGIRAVFGSSKLFDVQLYTEYLDVSRFGGLANDRAMVNLLHSKYSGMEIHAIITVYPYAADFLLAERRTLFPEVPIIAAELTSRSAAENLERSPARRFVTGTILGDNIAAIMDDALRVRPQTKRIALVAGTAPNDSQGEQIFRSWFMTSAGRLDLVDLTGLSIEETLSRAGTLEPDTLVFYSTLFRDGAGKSFVPREALSLIARAANVPVFGLYESYLGFGIVGGRLVSLEEQGKEAAALALRILGGEAPASIPFGGERAYVTAYDWRELKRWNIPEAALPPGSEIRYRIPSFWEEYRGLILGVISLVIIETGLILGLLINVRRRRKAELSLRESEDRVKLAVSSAGAGLWSWDVSTGVFWATERGRELFGFAPEEPLNNERMLSLIHPADRDLVRLSLQQAAESGEEATLEYRVVPPDGNVRWISARGRLQQNMPGKSKRLMGTCVDVTARKAAEETMRQHEKELMTLTGRLISTQEEELRRLSRDLHDDLTQRLAVLAIDAGMLEKTLRPLQPQASQELADLKTQLIEVSDEVHNLSRQLHPSILDDLGLVQAIQSECDTFSRRTGIALSFEPETILVSIPPDSALCLYRVMQEALQNIAKHAKARAARIVLQDLPDGVHLMIQDSGIGFDVNQSAGKGGIGLSGMRERARLVNGTVSVVSEPGNGTRIHVIIPVRGTHHVQTEYPDR